MGPPARTAVRLLDREEELAVIAASLADARSGQGGLVVIEGPGGIGKTALLLAAASEARAHGMGVGAARASELERAFAFGVTRQLLEPAAAGPGAESLLAGAAGLSRPVFELTEPDGGERSLSVLHGLYWLCANLAERAPLLLAVDDAQWADAASLEFLAYLARRVGDLPLALIVATRPPADTPEERIIDEIRADPRAALVRPRRLGRQAVADLVRETTGREEPDPAFLAACGDATDGNPFLLHQLVREVQERGIELSARAAPAVRELGPRTVARRVLARLVRAAPEAVRVARAAAVLGADAETVHVARLAGLEPDRVGEALDELDAAGVTTGSRPVAFHHPIVRSAIYADIPAGERAAMHAAAARVLVDAGAPAERVAGHLLETEPEGREATVAQLLAVALAALARGAPASAVTYLQRALAEPPPPERRPALLSQLGLAESLLGDPRAVGHLRGVLEQSSDPAAQGAAARALARFLVLSGAPGQAATIFEGVHPGSTRRGLELEAAAVSAALGDVEAASQVDARVAALRERAAADPDVPPGVFAALAIAGAQGIQPADEVAALARRALAHPGPAGAGWATRLVAVFTALLFAEAYDDAEEAVEEALALARAQGWAAYVALGFAMRGCVALRRGSLVDAEADARAALETAPRQARGFYGLYALATLVESLVERDQLDEAERELERIGLPDRPTAVTFGAVLHARGRLRLAQHRPQDALADFEATGRHMQAACSPSPSPGAWRSGSALALLALGRADEGRTAVAEEIELARQIGLPRATGVALRAAGLIEGGTAGIARLEEAVRVLETSQGSLELARALADLGAGLRRAGRRAEARDPLRRALDLAHRCGAEAIARQAHTELLAAGARPRKVLLTGPEALTASERRIAEMAAAGMTNRDIAQALFVTARTVETHLTHAFQKLGIDSRAGLSSALRTPAP